MSHPLVSLAPFLFELIFPSNSYPIQAVSLSHLGPTLGIPGQKVSLWLQVMDVLHDGHGLADPVADEEDSPEGGGGVEIGVHRRRIKTEEKAKVVGVGWGTYLNAALTI